MGESNLIKFFGDTPFLRIVDALIDGLDDSFTKKEIQELAEISKATFFKHWPKIEELNLVKVTKTIGRTKLYTLNTKNQFVKDLLKFEMRMIEETSLKKELVVA